MSMRSRLNWNLEVLVFVERGKPEKQEKNLFEQGREPTTNSTHIWLQHRDLNLGHIGGRRVLSPLRHLFSHCLTCLLQMDQIWGVRSIQPKFRPVWLGKVVHLKRWTSFFENFPVGPNRSIEFWLNGSHPGSPFSFPSWVSLYSVHKFNVISTIVSYK